MNEIDFKLKCLNDYFQREINYSFLDYYEEQVLKRRVFNYENFVKIYKDILAMLFKEKITNCEEFKQDCREEKNSCEIILKKTIEELYWHRIYTNSSLLGNYKFKNWTKHFK